MKFLIDYYLLNFHFMYYYYYLYYQLIIFLRLFITIFANSYYFFLLNIFISIKFISSILIILIFFIHFLLSIIPILKLSTIQMVIFFIMTLVKILFSMELDIFIHNLLNLLLHNISKSSFIVPIIIWIKQLLYLCLKKLVLISINKLYFIHQ